MKGQGCLEAVKVILMDIAGPSVTLESHMLNKITNTIVLDRRKKIQPGSGARKALKVLNAKPVVATNAYTGKKVVLPGLKRSAFRGQQVA